jgi:hypothetical protein
MRLVEAGNVSSRLPAVRGKLQQVRLSGSHPLLIPISAPFFYPEQLERRSRAPSPWRPWIEGSDRLRHELPVAARWLRQARAKAAHVGLRAERSAATVS